VKKRNLVLYYNPKTGEDIAVIDLDSSEGFPDPNTFNYVFRYEIVWRTGSDYYGVGKQKQFTPILETWPNKSITEKEFERIVEEHIEQFM
jgi:hypothetical protein